MKILISTIIATFFLASCSQQRYGGITKVKHPKKNEAIVVSNERIQTDVVLNRPAEKFEIKTIAKSSKVEKITLETPQNYKVETPQKTLKNKKHVINLGKIFTIPLNPQTYQTQQHLTERKMQLQQHHNIDTQAARGWFYYIVVGLIFLLIAGLLANGSLLSGIFAIVGFIAIIYGLLALIDIV